MDICTLTLTPVGDTPPTEFRIFAAGLNPTENGHTVLFDAKAAADVMAAYQTWGVDLMIDLDHQSLDPATYDDARNARGWFKLALRNGELWAVDVKWNEDGARRLAQKTQRYISPAFDTAKVEGKPGVIRPVALLNAALCAMPATRNAPALVAACRRLRLARNAMRATLRKSMSPEQVKKAIDVVAADDGKSAIELLKEFIAGLAGGSEGPPAAPESAAVDPAGEVPGSDKPTEEAALLAKAEKLSRENAAKTNDRLTKLQADVARLTAANDALANEERGELVAELVKLGVETPATAFEKDAAGLPVAGKICKRLSSESVRDMRDRVKALSASRGTSLTAPKGASPEAGSKDFTTSRGVVVRLTARELQNCVDAKADPQAYAENKSVRDAARGVGRSQ